MTVDLGFHPVKDDETFQNGAPLSVSFKIVGYTEATEKVFNLKT